MIWGNNQNHEPSVSCSSKDLVSASCHSGEAQLSSSANGAPEKSVRESEVVDLTGVDSPQSCASIESSKDDALESNIRHKEARIESSKKSVSVTDSNQFCTLHHRWWGD